MNIPSLSWVILAVVGCGGAALSYVRLADELASIRQMTTTKIFMRNSDREIEYVSPCEKCLEFIPHT